MYLQLDSWIKKPHYFVMMTRFIWESSVTNTKTLSKFNCTEGNIVLCIRSFESVRYKTLACILSSCRTRNNSRSWLWLSDEVNVIHCSFFLLPQTSFHTMKAVITGASGLLGRPTVNAFKNAGYDGMKKCLFELTRSRFLSQKINALFAIY